MTSAFVGYEVLSRHRKKKISKQNKTKQKRKKKKRKKKGRQREKDVYLAGFEHGTIDSTRLHLIFFNFLNAQCDHYLFTGIVLISFG